MTELPQYIYREGKRYKLDTENAEPEAASVDFADLVGIKTLDAVDFTNEMRQRYSGSDDYEDCQVCRFRVDGVTYIAVEDPSDGYRSHIASFSRYVDVVPMQNVFAECKVLSRVKTKSQYGHECDILEMIDITTGKVVLEVGTDNNDDYYPSFVAAFSPENMAVNAAVEE